MKTNKALAAALALSFVSAAAEPKADPLQALTDAYRAGNVPEALDRAADVLEADPKNREVRHYLWTLGRRLKEEEKAGALKPGERAAAVHLAEHRLEARRRETEGTLALLKESFEKSRRTRSPQDVLAGAEGMGRFLGSEFEEERQRALADGYFRGLVENLTLALKQRAFVTRKDQLVAGAWLAYYTGRKRQALQKWEAAAKEDPADKDVANNLDQLRRLLRREEDEKMSRLWESQAATFQETGFPQEALELWEKILAKAPGRPDVLRRAEECRVLITKKALEARLSSMTEEGVKLYKEGRVVDAAQTWFRVLERDPSHRQARVWLTHAGRQLGTSGAAEPAHAARPAGAPKAAYTGDDEAAALELHKQGLIAYAQDHVARAVELWEKALERYPALTQSQEALRQARAELSFKKNAAR